MLQASGTVFAASRGSPPEASHAAHFQVRVVCWAGRVTLRPALTPGPLIWTRPLASSTSLRVTGTGWGGAGVDDVDGGVAASGDQGGGGTARAGGRWGGAGHHDRGTVDGAGGGRLCGGDGHRPVIPNEKLIVTVSGGQPLLRRSARGTGYCVAVTAWRLGCGVCVCVFFAEISTDITFRTRLAFDLHRPRASSSGTGDRRRRSIPLRQCVPLTRPAPTPDCRAGGALAHRIVPGYLYGEWWSPLNTGWQSALRRTRAAAPAHSVSRCAE